MSPVADVKQLLSTTTSIEVSCAIMKAISHYILLLLVSYKGTEMLGVLLNNYLTYGKYLLSIIICSVITLKIPLQDYTSKESVCFFRIIIINTCHNI